MTMTRLEQLEPDMTDHTTTEATMTTTLTKQPKHVDAARKALRATGADRIMVGMVRGKAWLTNSYWAMPARDCPARAIWATGVTEEDAGSYTLAASPNGSPIEYY